MRVFRGDIYLASLPEGIGSEQTGNKPVLIIQNDTGNKFSPTTIACIITSKLFKKPLPTHVVIPDSVGMHKPSIILCEQIMVLSLDRIGKKVGFMDDMSKVDEALAISLGLKEVGHSERYVVEMA